MHGKSGYGTRFEGAKRPAASGSGVKVDRATPCGAEAKVRAEGGRDVRSAAVKKPTRESGAARTRIAAAEHGAETGDGEKAAGRCTEAPGSHHAAQPWHLCAKQGRGHRGAARDFFATQPRKSYWSARKGTEKVWPAPVEARASTPRRIPAVRRGCLERCVAGAAGGRRGKGRKKVGQGRKNRKEGKGSPRAALVRACRAEGGERKGGGLESARVEQEGDCRAAGGAEEPTSVLGPRAPRPDSLSRLSSPLTSSRSRCWASRRSRWRR